MSEPELPKAIGAYRIQGRLGQGAMGVVFKGVHETLERPAAVKLLPPELAQNPEYVSRFLREARVIAALRHDHIVQVYDAGAFEGKYYIAMELVAGTSLAGYLQEKKVLDENRNVRIVDFGLVMESASTTQLTATGACLGTPMYMSPEQTDGEKADPRSDLYSLGVTFYRALTGQPPFSSTTVMNLLFKHRFEAPPDPRSIRPELSEDISNLLLALMAKPREDRPQSAQKLVELIEGYRQGKKIPPPPPFRSPLASEKAQLTTPSPSPGAAPRQAVSRRAWIGLSAAAVILVVCGIVAYLLLRSPPGGGQVTLGGGGTVSGGSTASGGDAPSGGGTASGGAVKKEEPGGKKSFNVDEFAVQMDPLVRDGRENDAFVLLAAALREYPQEPRLLQLKAGLEGLQACEAICRGLAPVLAKGETAAGDARRVDSDDDQARRYQDGFAAKARECLEREAQARARFLSHAYDGLRGLLTEAKTSALLASADFQSAYERYEKKAKDAAEFKGLNVGLFRIGAKGDKEKADKYTRIATTFSGLTQEARALSQ